MPVCLAELPPVLQSVFTTSATMAARASGFVQRRSKLTGAAFVQTLVFGWLANRHAPLSQLVQAAAVRVPISPQGLDQRFGPAAAACLQQVLAVAIGQVIAGAQVPLPLVQRFAGVYLLDSTTISLPAALASVWRGCGGRTPGSGAAALKLQVGLDLVRGALWGLELCAGRLQDKAAHLQHAVLPANVLRITDLGYYSLRRFRALATQGGWWLTRLHPQTVVLVDGRRQPVPTLLAAHGPAVLAGTAPVDVAVQVGARERLPCRLLAWRVPPAVAAERRRKMHAEAQREGETVSAIRGALADWTVLLTNVPADQLSVEEAMALYRARWQIELLFKQWKSQGGLAVVSRSTKPWHVLCEVYAKLLGLLVQHWLLVAGGWHHAARSLWKAAPAVRVHALVLAAALRSRRRLRAVLTDLQTILAATTPIDRRRSRPPTFLRLRDAPTPADP